MQFQTLSIHETFCLLKKDRNICRNIQVQSLQLLNCQLFKIIHIPIWSPNNLWTNNPKTENIAKCDNKMNQKQHRTQNAIPNPLNKWNILLIENNGNICKNIQVQSLQLLNCELFQNFSDPNLISKWSLN